MRYLRQYRNNKKYIFIPTASLLSPLNQNIHMPAIHLSSILLSPNASNTHTHTRYHSLQPDSILHLSFFQHISTTLSPIPPRTHKNKVNFTKHISLKALKLKNDWIYSVTQIRQLFSTFWCSTTPFMLNSHKMMIVRGHWRFFFNWNCYLREAKIQKSAY